MRCVRRSYEVEGIESAVALPLGCARHPRHGPASPLGLHQGRLHL
ncbi:unnamed protein product [Musa acuminata subsp. malaccensis]|nr:unnamed protein product [Musa acuminata subsp. malaccensis]